MKQTIFLFYGFGSEYVLHGLYKEMKKRKYICLEIDVLAVKDSTKMIQNLRGKQVVFVTSAHFLLNKKNFTEFYPNNNIFYGVLEIIQLIKPIKSVYIPHDLTQPVIDKEIEYLNQFDLFLTPTESFNSVFAEYCRTEEVGWIKLSEHMRKIQFNNSKTAIWLLSDYVLYLKMGKEASFKKLQPVLDQGVSIKFPFWMESESFTQYFKNKGVVVYSPQANSIELIMKHQIIITNGLSSINAESYLMGKTTINIEEGSHYGDSKTYLTELLPDIMFYEKISDFKLADIPILKKSCMLKPFNMKKTIELIMHTL
ncbi:MAG TPA: hypothetical protein VJH96_03380 [Patescibacteria group bacterium]|nr:hypothetical protein [Patescibacteria group bacterium]